MQISDEAVEAAAMALYKGQPMWDEATEELTGYRPWSWATPTLHEALRADARASLEAAAPHMLAEAWAEGRKHGARYPYGQRVLATDDNPYRSKP